MQNLVMNLQSMATKDPNSSDDKSKGNTKPITQEETNYLRIANLLLRVAPPAVRKVFDKEFNPSGLQTALNIKQNKLLSLKEKKRVINQKQWDLLFPTTGNNAASSTFDLTLMICLIRHLTKIQIQDTLPAPTEVDVGAALSRLKYYRNQITHDSDGILSDTEFKSWWDDISQAIIRLGGPDYQQKCWEVKHCRLDDNDREILTELRNIEVSDDPVPKGVKSTNSKIIRDWKESNKTVFQTNAIKSLLDMIIGENEDVITVIGSPGCGKTTAIHRVALELHQLYGFDLIPVFSLFELKHFYDPDRKQVFVFDDVCGKFSVDLQSVRNWNDYSSYIQKMLDDKKLKILLSCRTPIFNQLRNVKILSQSVFNMLSSKNCLTMPERLEISKSYLTEAEVEIIQDMNVCQYDFFPLLCRLYSMNRSKDIRQFFTSPVDVIKEDLKSLMDAEDQTTFATLALFVIYNNKLPEDQLCRKSQLQQILSEISSECKMSSVFSIKVVQEQLVSLEKSYIKKTNNCYSILHDKLFDIIVSFYGESLFELILDFCHSDIIRDRYQLDMVGDKVDECLIIIPKKHEERYFSLMIKYLIEGNLDVIFENRQMNQQDFRNKVIENCTQREDVRNVLLTLSKGEKSPLIIISSAGYSDILKWLIEMGFDVNQTDKNGRTSLFFASENGHTECVKLLLSHGGDPNICAIRGFFEGKSPLLVASKKGHIECVELLLSHGGDPNICAMGLLNKGLSPLNVASEKGHTECVKLLLSHGGDPNICAMSVLNNGLSPLYVASKKGHSECVKLLLSHGVDPNICAIRGLFKGKSPLIVASKKGHSECVKLLLSHGVDPNICVMDGLNKWESPLYVASTNGHTECVELLLSHGGDPNICRKDEGNIGESPLYVASINGHSEIVQLLLAHNANVNTCLEYESNKGESPLYAASKKGYIEIVKLLINHSSDPYLCCTNKKHFGESPLYVASKNGHTEIVKFLLDNGIGFKQHKVLELNSTSNSYNYEIIKLLLQHNCLDLNECDRYCQSPLFLASRRGNTELVRLLLHFKYNPNICNKNSLSPVLIAARKGYTKIVEVLIDYKANVNLCDKYNQSPLFFAVKNRHYEIVRMLLEHDANPCIYTENGLSVLAVSLINTGKSINVSIVKALLIEYQKRQQINDKELRLLTLSLECSTEAVRGFISSNPNSDLLMKEFTSPVFIASCFNAHQLLKMLLDNIPKEKAYDKSFSASLLAACGYGYTEIVRLLLDFGCDPNKCSLGGERPLCVAAEHGHESVAKLLLEYGCDPNLCNKNNESPIYVASELNYPAMVHDILQYNSKSNKENKHKEKSLYKATLLNHMEIVKLFIEHETDTNACNMYGESPLFVAVMMGYKELVILLLKHGSDPNICSKYNESPLHIAAKETPMYAAVEEGRQEIVKLLLDNKGDPNICNVDNQTPLFIASSKGCGDVVKLLLEHDCNPNLCNSENESPLYAASEMGHADVVSILLDKRSDFNLCNTENKTPLFTASQKGHVEVVELLLQNNANPEISDNDGNTPLLIATKHGNIEVVELLLLYGSNPFICNKMNKLPWEVAFEWGHEDIGSILLNYESIM